MPINEASPDDEPSSVDFENDDDVVILVDDDGQEHALMFLAVIIVEGAGQFAALTPADEDEEAESTDVFVYHYEVDEDDNETFTPVEGEDLFAKVQAAFEQHFDLMDKGHEADAFTD